MIIDALICGNFTILGNTTEIVKGWVDGPTRRGTWQIFYSCVFTLVLCAYTAIHLNVPGKKKSKRAYWLKVSKWVAIAILIPEIIVFMAVQQWWQAQKLQKELKIHANACKDRDSDFKTWYTQDRKKEVFNLTYAHYVVMGGFAVDVRHLHNTLKQLTITPTGMVFLARNGFFCRIETDDIDDKSKADLLAKGLVCVQVSWLVGQTVERYIAGLPVTMLELHAVIHVVCAMVMYASWLKKPHRVECPTLVSFAEQPGLLSFLIELRSPMYDTYSQIPKDETEYASARGKKGFGFDIDRGRTAVFEEDPPVLKLNQMQHAADTVAVHETGPDMLAAAAPAVLQPHSQSDARAVNVSSTGELSSYDSATRNPGEGYLGPDDRPNKSFVPIGKSTVHKLGPSDVFGRLIFGCSAQNSRFQHVRSVERYTVSLSQQDMNRYIQLDRAWDEVAAQVAVNPSNHHPGSNPEDFCTPLSVQFRKYQGSSTHRQRNLITATLSTDNKRIELLYFLLVWGLLPCSYGGVHLFALYESFATPLERTLWKIACYYTMSTVIPCAILLLSSLMFTKSAPPGKHFALSVLLPLYVTTYMVARVFIVVESFISLRALSMAAFVLPKLNIMENIPHF